MTSSVNARPGAWVCIVTLLSVSMIGSISAAHAKQGESAVRVEVEQASNTELVNEVPLTGSLSAARVATLSAEVSGLVSELDVDIGDRLDAGDTLLRLNDELAGIALQRARASATSARERLEDSERRLAEAQTLGASNNIAASEVRSRQSQVEVDRAELAVARAEVQQREAELRRHHVTVPFSGTLSRKLVEIGEWVNPGTGLLEIISSQALRADFQVPQRFYPMIEDDSRLTLRFDAYPGKNFTGQVVHKVPQSRERARTFLLRVALDEEDRPPMLIAGMSVDATLRLARGEKGVAVNRDALLRYPDGRVTVWIVERGENENQARVTEQQVEPGLSFAGKVEIVSGLEAGEEVVVRGNEALREDQQVHIIDSES
ncbi:efflux RND transporter periplasmic adaptor subunit [Halopseudomonas sp.]|uniref:efflux RND transporter periplasmic adaptor subunit n=1 Tax=Halopseudomonas sp. TaxID=2901191 RepID=UPI0035683652